MISPRHAPAAAGCPEELDTGLMAPFKNTIIFILLPGVQRWKSLRVASRNGRDTITTAWLGVSGVAQTGAARQV
jgi:hypothetical protein